MAAGLSLNAPQAAAFQSPLPEGPVARSPVLSVRKSLGVDSEAIFRGHQLAEASVRADVNVTYGALYMVMRGQLPLAEPVRRRPEQQAGNRAVRLSLGTSQPLNRRFALDLGATYALMPDRVPGAPVLAGRAMPLPERRIEPFIGFTADAPGRPRVRLHQDVTVGTTTIETGLRRDIPVAARFVFGLGLDLGHVSGTDSRPAYGYTNVSGELSRRLSERARLTAGVRWSAASRATFFDDAAGQSFRDNSLRWGVALRAGF